MCDLKPNPRGIEKMGTDKEEYADWSHRFAKLKEKLAELNINGRIIETNDEVVIVCASPPTREQRSALKAWLSENMTLDMPVTLSVVYDPPMSSEEFIEELEKKLEDSPEYAKLHKSEIGLIIIEYEDWTAAIHKGIEEWVVKNKPVDVAITYVKYISELGGKSE